MPQIGWLEILAIVIIAISFRTKRISNRFKKIGSYLVN